MEPSESNAYPRPWNCQTLKGLDIVANQIIRHRSPCPFRKETDHLVFPVFPVFESGGDEFALQLFLLNGLEVLIGCQIDDEVVIGLGQFLIKQVGQFASPKLVQVLSGGGFECRTHLQAVRSNQIQRTQDSIQSGQDPDLLLRL